MIYTGGKWRSDSNSPHTDVVYTLDEDGKKVYVADVWTYGEAGEGNLKLILAAPKMYQVLKQLYGLFSVNPYDPDKDWDLELSNIHNVYDLVRAGLGSIEDIGKGGSNV